jgi:hypothetical protein
MTSSTYHEVSKTKSSSHLGFDWAVVTLSLWMVAGVHLDAWAHHRFASTLEPPGLPTPLCLGHTCAFTTRFIFLRWPSQMASGGAFTSGGAA